MRKADFRTSVFNVQDFTVLNNRSWHVKNRVGSVVFMLRLRIMGMLLKLLLPWRSS
jgi:hypothetical protein